MAGGLPMSTFIAMHIVLVIKRESLKYDLLLNVIVS